MVVIVYIVFPVCVRVCVFTVCSDCDVCAGVVFDLHCVIVKALCVYVCVSSVVCDLHCVVVQAVRVCVCDIIQNGGL